MIPIPILYEDKDIVIVNKKAGLAVQGGAEITHSLDNILQEQLGYKVFPVHRLDKDTAGILVVAKSSKAAAYWSSLLVSDCVSKEYIALCVGSLSERSVGMIAEQIHHRGKIQNATTHYRVEQTAAVDLNGVETRISMIRLELETGRMHQIRIHLAQRKCPIIADDKYGDFKVNKMLRQVFGIRKLLLASVSLSVPISGKAHVFTIPYPPHMEEAIKMIFG